jgi:hypothetical protein
MAGKRIAVVKRSYPEAWERCGPMASLNKIKRVHLDPLEIEPATSP